MYLQKLEINGFKSFAKKTTLEFTKGVTAIVGPNGTGKSNIADAIRWVMGEQSIKVLRGKRSQDVIFSGSDRKSRLGMASVSLYINNEDRAMPIDYSEVVITRAIHRNGEGEYFINKKRSRLQDIIMLLARSNVGQKTYSVIGQGMIDTILTSSPTERKAFFEEAAGVRQFQMKRDIAIHKLERTQDNLHQADLLLSEIGPRLRSLNRQMGRLKRRGEIEGGLRAVQKHYYSKSLISIQKDLDGQRDNTGAIEAKKKDISSSLADVQRKLDEHEKAETRESAFWRLQTAYDDILDKKNVHLREQAVLKGKLELEETKLSGASLVWLKKKAEDLGKAIRRQEEEQQNLSESITKLGGKLDEKRKQQQEIINEFEGIEAELLKTKDALENQNADDWPKMKQGLEVIHVEFHRLAESVRTATETTSLQSLVKSVNTLVKQLDAFVNDVDRITRQSAPQEMIKLQTKLSTFLKTKDSLVNEINDLSVRFESAKEKRNFITTQIRSLKEERDSIQSELSRSNIEPSSKDDHMRLLMVENDALQDKIDKLDIELRTRRGEINTFNKDEQDKRDTLFALQKEFRHRQHELSDINAQLNDLHIAIARFETRRDDLTHEMKVELDDELLEHIMKEPKLDQEFEKLTDYEVTEKIQKLKHQIELIGGIDEGIEEEHTEISERHEFLSKQSNDLKKAMKSLEKAIDELDETIRKQFDESFKSINKEFSKYFRILFKGGNAKLVLQKAVEKTEAEEAEEEMVAEAEGEIQPKEEEEESYLKKRSERTIEKTIAGIEIQATPPGKKISTINILSGGERALTSIALVVAILANNPSPFVVLDETDAALDEANSIKYASILEQLSEKTQFITITHNRATMQQAGILYGCTMGSDGVSKLLSVKMEEAEDVIKKHGNR